MTATIPRQMRFVPRAARLRDWCAFPTVASLFAGLLTNVRFHFGGLASVGETVLALVALFAVFANLANPRFWKRRLLIGLLALGVSLLGYILSDLINSTPPDRLLRGWARMAFVIMDFTAIWALSRNSTRNLVAVCVGDSLSSLLSYFQEPRHDLFYDYKFHFAMPFTVIVMLGIPLLLRRRADMATGIGVICMGMCHIWVDSRTAGAVCILVGFVMIARRLTASRLRSLYLSLLALALILSSTAIGLLYTVTDSSFGDRRESSNSFRFSAAMAGINAIKRSPVIGLGSWVWDPEMWNTFSARMGRANIGNSSAGDTMGPHSQIVQAWAEAGLLGLVFFVYFGRLLLKALYILCFRRTLDWMTPLFLCYLLLALWDLCFSPFANLHRFLIALNLAMAIHILSERISHRARADLR